MFVVTVNFQIHPDAWDAFLPLMSQQAETSRTTEPGCQRFDLCWNADRPEMFLYEAYDSEAAFESHLQSAHFAQFDQAVTSMVASKTVRTFTCVQS